MAQNVTINGVNYSDVPAVNLPKTLGGSALFLDVEEYRTAAEQNVIDAGKISKSAQVTRTAEMTQPVGIDADGKLWAVAGGGGGDVTFLSVVDGSVNLTYEDGE